MSWIVRNMKGVMVVCGVLTSTMIAAAIAPQAVLASTFGENLTGPLADVIVRSWGSLVAMTGGMLVYGAYHAPARALVLVIAILGKAFFVALVLGQGARFLPEAAVVVVSDTAMVALFASYLTAVNMSRAALVK
jgi:hypothetical protein